MTQLRIGSNQLDIDQKRQLNISADQRTCFSCAHQCVEDEPLFLVHCVHYAAERKWLFDRTLHLTDQSINLNSLSHSDQLDYILCGENQHQFLHKDKQIASQQISSVIMFIYDIMKKREFHLIPQSSQSSDHNQLSQSQSSIISSLDCVAYS